MANEQLRTELAKAETLDARARNPFCSTVKIIEWDLYQRLLDALAAQPSAGRADGAELRLAAKWAMDSRPHTGCSCVDCRPHRIIAAKLEAMAGQEPVAWYTMIMGKYAKMEWGAKRPDYLASTEWAPLYAGTGS